jgi:hypothetical protein
MRTFAQGVALSIVLCAAVGPGALPAPQEGRDAPPASGTAGGRTVLGMVRGTVYDAQRKPVAGLMVQLVARAEGGLLRVTGTNERGQYVFADLPPGVYDVELTLDERRQRKNSITVRPPFRNIVDFQVDETPAPAGPGRKLPIPPAGTAVAPGSATAPGAAATTGGAAAARVTVRGRFLDSGKRPVAEVSVTLVALEGGATHQAFSGDDGTFAVDGVAPGRYRVLVASPGHVALDMKSVEVTPAHGLNLELTLVDHPLNLRNPGSETPPREEPLPAP